LFLLALVPSAPQLQQKKEKKESNVASIAFFDAKKRGGDNNTFIAFFAARE
jgi:hypothetical protein